MRLLESALRRLGAEDKENQKKLVLQFIRFGFVGLSNTLVSLACYYLFLWINEDLYMIGSIVGTIVSIANAFYWNDRFVFTGGEQTWRARLKRLGKTYVSYGGTSFLTIVLLWLEVQLGVSRSVAPLVNLFITIPLNFVVNKLWTFKK